MKYLIAKNVPGAEDRSVPSEIIRRAIKRSECAAYIDYSRFHDEDWSTPWSRRDRYRARPFVVRDYMHDIRSSHYTLEAAEKAAAKWVKALEPDFKEEV